jgi:oxygen-independent coproporphyrinogen-3 oxidase
LPPLSLYIHIPWCIQKCPYCDFNSHAVKSDTPETEYITALLRDLANDIQRYSITRPISSIFIGGGTPSLFSPESVNLLRGIEQQLGKDGLKSRQANQALLKAINLLNSGLLALTAYRSAYKALTTTC